MKRDSRIIFISGLGLFFFMLASLLLMSDAMQNSERFGRLYSALLVLNAVGLLVMLILIGVNIRQLIQQLRNRVAGARMTVRMVLMLTTLSVTPVLIVYWFSLDFLNRGIDNWFDLRVESALNDSLELSRLALDGRMRDMLRRTRQVADEFIDVDNAAASFEIDEMRRRIGAEELTLMSRQGRFIASSSSDATQLVPTTPSDSIFLQLRQGNSYVGLDTVKENELVIRTAVNVPDISIQSDNRVLQALYPVSQRMNELADSVESAYEKYRELSYLREQLKLSFTLLLTLVLLFSIFSIVWAAFYTARRLAAPIRDLAMGTKAIASGDYSMQLPVPSNDELGVLVASFNDMTREIARARDAVHQSRQEAEAQRAYLEAVLGRLSSGVLVLDQERNLRTSNVSASQILGLPISPWIGKHLHDLCETHPHLLHLEEVITPHLESQEDWRAQVTLFGGSGRQVLMCSGTSLPSTTAEQAGFVIVFDDITTLIQSQRDAAWGEVARRLAHEIKNPLTPIQLSAERIRHKYMQAETPDLDLKPLDRLTNTIIQQVETMKDMVNTFSEYARAPALEPQPIDLNELVREVLDLFHNLDPGAQVDVDLEPNLPPVNADPGRLRQVLNNLVNNAFDASCDNEPIQLALSTQKIRQGGLEFVEIRISDSGCGISDELIGQIFEPYITTKTKGTGLGLAIVKKIIEEHGGMVWLENNTPAAGASAVIRLPLDSDANNADDSDTDNQGTATV
ncbi:nitrogen fixation/metabolism regulation signal transduction histidine kinase [Methylohalomonas lacus]|uniref:histidine kinase n=1 Tax=Methylohalomonas lacus TaxID=398773 RepID=A0AAE3HPH3_9GAMM|nr:ATP-binding protein [Methylohalomonas lacus]MCS3904498.1 nitrogen fixation/metabolism regulation signal transduction histidine kinase [Methylohalomonas lacus]